MQKNLKAISNRLVAIMDNLDSGLIVEDPQNNIITSTMVLFNVRFES